jgi:hypothetical protein
LERINDNEYDEEDNRRLASPKVIKLEIENATVSFNNFMASYN